MKIRNGFVSNSSSSSFILKFNKIPKTKEDMRILLFGENPPIFTSYWSDNAISTEKISNIIFDDIEDTSFINLDNMILTVKKEIECFGEYNCDDGRRFVNETKYVNEFDKLYEEITKETNRFSKVRQEYYQKGDKDRDGFDVGWEEHNKIIDILSEPIFKLIEKSLRDKYKDEKFIYIEYGDDNENSSFIEHSGILDKITVQRFSHH